MAYEIPQQLKYEEKIVFGLTFKQLAYAALFVIPALVIFLRTEWNLYIKISIEFILLGAACLFIFFDFASYLRDLVAWLKFREAHLMDPKMVQFLGIKKIDKGVVYANKTKKRLT